MEHQVALYLFRNKSCTLPGIGKLSIGYEPAQYLGMEEKLCAPKPIINFEQSTAVDDHLALWLSERNGISSADALKYIETISNRILQLKEDEKFSIPAAGEFLIDSEGILQFSEAGVNPALTPDVPAVTWSRAAEHSILVGNTESSATEMTAYFADSSKPRIASWKIITIILFVIVTAWLCWYFISLKGGTGNIRKIEVNNQPQQTYRTSQP